ncbi:YfhE family protein [Virgibacillus necropolis]|uniref:YfhE family protein n=1 Tax=Virgibacillus necropolis TaxID=163877 RepID=A0A221MGZ3_9BACI|nr:YfhE family protein [Virgibacillus necropolis]
MKDKSKSIIRVHDNLNKTQEVLYQKEFKRANSIYQQNSQKSSRS